MSDMITMVRPARLSRSALADDLRRHYQLASGGAPRKVFECLRCPGVHAAIVFRFGHWTLSCPKWTRIALDPLYWIANFLIQAAWGIELSREARIGGGLHIDHFGGITISGRAVIGKNCNLSQATTIGMSGDGVPTIGDDCYIAPGARVFGKIVVGNNVKIGANAVVHKDIPDNAIVVLDPGFRILSYAGNRRRAQ
jgi:serine O-acetyltransferase